MAADLHIHVLDGCTERDVEIFSSNTLGSKFGPSIVPGLGLVMREFDPQLKAIADMAVSKTPSIWIGEVSWLKAALFEDGEDDYIPNTVGAINELVTDEFPIINANFICEVHDAFKLTNDTSYSLAEEGKVMDFLTDHFGKRVFKVSW